MKAPAGVGAAVERVRVHLRRRARLAAALWLGAAAAAVLALAWWLAGTEGWRQGTAAPLALDLLLLALAAALVAGLVRGGRRWLGDVPLARAMEASAGLETGEVEGALQLSRGLPEGASPSLAALAERGVALRLGLPDERLAGALGSRAGTWVRRGAAALALTTPLVVLLGLAAPGRAADAWVGLGRPIRLLARAELPALEVEPGNAEVLRGSRFTVTVRAPGRTAVTLDWQAAGDVARSETATLDERSEARFHFTELTARIAYSASAADGARSPTYRVTPTDPLLVTDVTLELAFPLHTGRAPEEYRGDAPPLTIPAGTRFRIEGRATRPLGEALLEREQDGLRVPLETAGSGFVASWVPRASGRFRWIFQDTGGGAAEVAPAPLDLTVVADSAPVIRMAYPGVDTVLPLSLRQPLVIEVSDDHGVGAVELVAYRVTSLGERRPPVITSMEMGGTRAILARPLMDLTSWGLLPGDTVRYFARAVDNAPSPSSAETREYVLRMPAAAELRREAQRELEAMAARLEELTERAAEAGRETREMEREAAAARPDASGDRPGRQPSGRRQDRAGFEEREELRRALEEQETLGAGVDSARAEIEAMAEALRQAGASDPGLQRDLEELQELLEQAMSPEARERMQEIAEAMQRSGSRESREALGDLAAEQERFREQLEKSLDRMRRAAVEQDFRATTQDARELAQREQALADALREGDDPELREQQQEELRQEAGELDQRMDELEQRLESLEEPAARQGVQEARAQASSARQSMQEAQRQAEQRRAQDAAEAADRAGEAMERTADALERAQEEMSTQQGEALQEALARTAEDALALARRQSEIREQMGAEGPEGMADLRGDEAALMQGLRNMAQTLEEEAGGQAGEARETSAGMGEAMEAVERTLEAMEGRRAGVPSPQNAAEQAAEALNRLALSALAAGEQASQGGSPGDQMMEQLEQLAQQQGQLNNRAGQVVPMQLGDQAMQQQMQELSRGQQQVAGELGEMSQQPGAEGRALGDLEALAQEADELASLLAGGRLDAETRERQERLFHRLLDAGRSLEKDELSDERESATPGTFLRGEVRALRPDELGALRFGLPSAEELARLSPAERELVLRYFERLNRAPAPPDAPAEAPRP